MQEREIRQLIEEVREGKLPRRGFIQQMVGLGLTAPMAGMMLMHYGVASAQTIPAYRPTEATGQAHGERQLAPATALIGHGLTAAPAAEDAHPGSESARAGGPLVGGAHPIPPTPVAPSVPVLYIDDNPVNTLLMAAMFERLPGLVLQSECQPQRGVDLALADPPALLLVDIQMPGLDGYEVLRLLRAAPATQAVPALAVSANAMPQDVARGHAAGFADYLTKPLELQRLRSAIQAVLPGWAAD